MAKTAHKEMILDWLGERITNLKSVEYTFSNHMRRLEFGEEGYSHTDVTWKLTCKCGSIKIHADGRVFEAEHVHFRTETIEGVTTIYVFKTSTFPFLEVSP